MRMPQREHVARVKKDIMLAHSLFLVGVASLAHKQFSNGHWLAGTGIVTAGAIATIASAGLLLCLHPEHPDPERVYKKAGNILITGSTIVGIIHITAPLLSCLENDAYCNAGDANRFSAS